MAKRRDEGYTWHRNYDDVEAGTHALTDRRGRHLGDVLEIQGFFIAVPGDEVSKPRMFRLPDPAKAYVERVSSR